MAGDADLHQPVTAIPPQSSGATSSSVSENVIGGPWIDGRVLALAVDVVGERVDDPGAGGLRALARRDRAVGSHAANVDPRARERKSGNLLPVLRR